MKKKYEITGMMCAACQANVQRAVVKVNGVRSVNVSLLAKNMVVDFDEAKANDESIISSVEKAGYGCSIYVNASIAEMQRKRQEALKHKGRILLYSILLLCVLMVFSMTPMFLGSSFMEREDYVPLMMGDIAIQFLFFVPIAILNRELFLSGFKALFHLRPNMQSLVSCGTTASIVYGIYCYVMICVYFATGNSAQAMSYTMNIYIESAAMIPVFVSMGKYFEARATTKTTASIAHLMALTPETAYKMVEGEPVEVTTDSLMEGDTVLVKSGASIPTDGKLLQSHASIDESALTGESLPKEHIPGDSLIGGTVNVGDSFQYFVTAIGKDSTMGKIVALVEEASESKAPLARLADRISLIFCPLVIGISLSVFVLWEILTACGVAGTSRPDTNLAIQLAISVMVISCPCALGLATPVAIMAGTGKGAEHGILIKSAEAFERLAKVDVVVFDKTGTLTEGNMEVREVIYANDGDASTLQIVGTMESSSNHPLSKALASFAKKQGAEFLAADGVQSIPGKGLVWKDYRIGNQELMEEQGVDLSAVLDHASEDASAGYTVLFFALGQRLLATFVLSDVIRENSKTAIKALQKLGKKVFILTGDSKKTAENIGARLGVDAVYSEIHPEEKESIVAEIQKIGNKVAMVGDGINDAPALMKADVGIAIGAGTDIAIDSADIVLVRSDPIDVVSAIELSAKVVKNIKENLSWAFFYNLLLIPLAAGALYGVPVSPNWFTGSQSHLVLTPMIGSMAMSISSVTVVLNALRLKRFKPRD